LYGTCRCVSTMGQDFIFSETLSPNRKHKVMMSAGDAGATGFSSSMSADIVAADATGPGGGCRLLFAETHAYLDEGRINVKWLDDSRVVLTYSDRIHPMDLRFSCGDIVITHVFAPGGPTRRVARDAG
jgi:hypothetical protein